MAPESRTRTEIEKEMLDEAMKIMDGPVAVDEICNGVKTMIMQDSAQQAGGE